MNQRWPVIAVLGLWTISAWAMPVAEAATPLEDVEDLVHLCELGSPQGDTPTPEERNQYHQTRRQAIHQVYETTLPMVDEELLRYERVSGLLTMSGFRNYSLKRGAPSIRFRNECILSFEVDEERVHDLMAQIRMGTVEVRIGYMVVAHQDYDEEFCPGNAGGDGVGELQVDLLYARLIDTESAEADSGEIIDTYQTQLGHQWALRRSTSLVNTARKSMPTVDVSHLQWRPRGKGWEGRFSEEGAPEGLEELSEELGPSIERALYSCYVRALVRNASLQGALVLEIAYGDENDRGSIDFLLDTIGDSGLRQCVEERVAEVDEVNGGPETKGVDAFKATILLRRQ